MRGGGVDLALRMFAEAGGSESVWYLYVQASGVEKVVTYQGASSSMLCGGPFEWEGVHASIALGMFAMPGVHESVWSLFVKAKGK